MRDYNDRKPRVYLETTVISYLVALLSANPRIAGWQQETRRFWREYAHRLEFVVSEIVIDEVSEGDTTEAGKRLAALAGLPVLQKSSAASHLSQKLRDARAVPPNLKADADHIAIATVHGVEYLVSWNHKHLVNENQLRQINSVCEAAGFQPVTICTPTALMEEFTVKEETPDVVPSTYTDPILEECYRIKRKIHEERARFTPEEHYAYVKAREAELKKQGWKIIPAPPHPADTDAKKD